MEVGGFRAILDRKLEKKLKSLMIIGFQKKIGWGWVCGMSSFFGCLNFFYFAKPLTLIIEWPYAGDMQVIAW